METQNTKLKELIYKYKEIFGLQNWKFELDFKNPTTEGAVKTFADPRYYIVNMRFSDNFKSCPDKWEETVIHEMIHVVMSLYDIFTDNLAIEGEKIDELFFLAREQAVSQLATIIMRMKGDIHAT